MRKLILGCGYLGSRVAQRWHAAGAEVFVVTRSNERAAQWQQQGLHPILADVTHPASLGQLPAANTVLYAVGYDREAGRSMRDVYVGGLANVLDALPPGIQRFIYISSTGVYGQTAGGWVDEDAPCEPTRDSGQVCLAAEQTLAAHALARRAVVLRLAGIYGPGRVPYRSKLVAGEPLPATETGYLNLIHVDDAAAVVLAAEQQAQPPARYLVSDGHPVLRHEYYAEVARLLNAPPPQFAPPAADTPRAARAASDKRIDNRRMLAELGVTLEYPSYREGLAAIIADRGS